MSLLPFTSRVPLVYRGLIGGLIRILTLLFTLLLTIPSHAIKHSQAPDYSNYKLSIEASNLVPSIGKPVVFKAKIAPYIDDSNIKYQFLINGEPIAEAGMHKVHIFQKIGNYKVSAVATLGGVHLLNSPTTIIHVSETWRPPSADITPKTLTVKTGEIAVFRSTSETDVKSRQWLYWSISSGHRGSGTTFTVNTSRLKEGKYPVTLLLRDDQQKESSSDALLIISNQATTTSPSEKTPIIEEKTSMSTTEVATEEDNGKTEKPLSPNQTTLTPIELTFRASHNHRFTGMPIIFWIQNAQIGANTQVQLNMGDGEISPWGKRLRYSHVYKQSGTYSVQLLTRINANKTPIKQTLTVSIWPLWLPLVILGLILLFTIFLLFKHRSRKRTLPTTPTSPVSYEHYPDEGYQQITIKAESEEKVASFSLSKQLDSGTQTLKPSQGKQQHGQHRPHNDH